MHIYVCHSCELTDSLHIVRKAFKNIYISLRKKIILHLYISYTCFGLTFLGSTQLIHSRDFFFSSVLNNFIKKLALTFKNLEISSFAKLL